MGPVTCHFTEGDSEADHGSCHNGAGGMTATGRLPTDPTCYK